MACRPCRCYEEERAIYEKQAGDLDHDIDSLKTYITLFYVEANLFYAQRCQIFVALIDALCH